MPAWLILLVQAEPMIAKMIDAALDEITTISEQDKQKIRDQLAAAIRRGDEVDAEFDSKTLALLDQAQAHIDALPDDHPAKTGIAATFAAIKDQVLERATAPLVAK